MFKKASLIALGLASLAIADTEFSTHTLFRPHSCTDTSDKVKSNDLVTMHYTVTIAPNSAAGRPGTVVESTQRRQPLRFAVGFDEVVPGLEKGIIGMCVGEKRRITVPPNLGYGRQGFGNVPPNASLEFTVELLKIEEVPNLFAEIDTNKDANISRDELRRWFSAPPRNVPRNQVEQLLTEAFRVEDTDKDGFISWDEYTGPKGTQPPSGVAMRTSAVGLMRAARDSTRPRADEDSDRDTCPANDDDDTRPSARTTRDDDTAHEPCFAPRDREGSWGIVTGRRSLDSSRRAIDSGRHALGSDHHGPYGMPPGFAGTMPPRGYAGELHSMHPAHGGRAAPRRYGHCHGYDVDADHPYLDVIDAPRGVRGGMRGGYVPSDAHCSEPVVEGYGCDSGLCGPPSMYGPGAFSRRGGMMTPWDGAEAWDMAGRRGDVCPAPRSGAARFGRDPRFSRAMPVAEMPLPVPRGMPRGGAGEPMCGPCGRPAEDCECGVPPRPCRERADRDGMGLHVMQPFMPFGDVSGPVTDNADDMMAEDGNAWMYSNPVDLGLSPDMSPLSYSPYPIVPRNREDAIDLDDEVREDAIIRMPALRDDGIVDELRGNRGVGIMSMGPVSMGDGMDMDWMQPRVGVCEPGRVTVLRVRGRGRDGSGARGRDSDDDEEEEEENDDNVERTRVEEEDENEEEKDEEVVERIGAEHDEGEDEN